MKVIYNFFFLFNIVAIAMSWECTTLKKFSNIKYHVSGTIMQTQSYCGGAQPTKEILDKLNKPTGIPDTKLFIRKSATNSEDLIIIDSIFSDSVGKFSIDLAPGTYCLVESWKAKRFIPPSDNQNQKTDTICLRNLYNLCDYVLEVDNKNIENVNIVFHRDCFYNLPCVTYKGPVPPKVKKPN